MLFTLCMVNLAKKELASAQLIQNYYLEHSKACQKLDTTVETILSTCEYLKGSIKEIAVATDTLNQATGHFKNYLSLLPDQGEPTSLKVQRSEKFSGQSSHRKDQESR